MRESGHGLKKVAKKNDFDFVEIHWGFGSTDYSSKVFLNAIFYATDAQ